jgi:alpha-D-xyloside xylohydrolase
MAVTHAQEAGVVTLARGGLRVEVSLDPLSIRVARDGLQVIDDLVLFTEAGGGADRLIELTEGVLVEEVREGPVPLSGATVEATESGLSLTAAAGAGEARITVSLRAAERVDVAAEVAPAPFRLGASWRQQTDERLTGLGARHGEAFDQGGRLVRLGADRRYTGPECPPEMLAEGGIPLGTMGRDLGRGPRARPRRANRGLPARRRRAPAASPAVRPDPERAAAALPAAHRTAEATARMGLRALEEPRRLRPST